MLAKRFISTYILTVALVLVSFHPTHATTVAKMSLEEMAEASPSIVHGSVLSTTSRWNEDRSLIITDVRVQVIDVLKGNPGQEIVVSQPGGTVGKLRVDVPGAAAFRPGQETILFLKPGPEGRSHVAGLFQGRYDVTEDPRTGKKLVRGFSGEQLDAQTLAAPRAGEERLAGRPLQPGSPQKPAELDQFLGGIRDLIRGTITKTK